MGECLRRVVHAVVLGSVGPHNHRILGTREAARPAFGLLECKPNAARHSPIDLQRMNIWLGCRPAFLARRACRGKPREHRRLVLGPAPFRVPFFDGSVGLDVGPETPPKRLAQFFMIDNRQRRHGAATTQRRAVPGTTARRISAQGEQRHCRRAATQRRGVAAFDEQVCVVAHGLGARSVDQQRCDVLAFRIFKRVVILQEARACAVQIERIGIGLKALLEHIRHWRLRPPIVPCVLVRWWRGGGEQANQEFVRRTIEVCARPCEADNRVFRNAVVDLPWRDTLDVAATAAHRQPRGRDQIEAHRVFYLRCPWIACSSRQETTTTSSSTCSSCTSRTFLLTHLAVRLAVLIDAC